MSQPAKISLIRPKPMRTPARRGLKLKGAMDLVREAKQLYRATRCGDLPTVDGYRLMSMLRAMGELIAIAELEAKLIELERAAAAGVTVLQLPAPYAITAQDAEEGNAE